MTKYLRLLSGVLVGLFVFALITSSTTYAIDSYQKLFDSKTSGSFYYTSEPNMIDGQSFIFGQDGSDIFVQNINSNTSGFDSRTTISDFPLIANAVADIDNDGYDDIIALTSERHLVVYYTSTRENIDMYVPISTQSGCFVPIGLGIELTRPQDLVIGDLNYDGLVDFTFSLGCGEIYSINELGAVNSGWPINAVASYAYSNQNLQSLQLSDVNGDGKSDLITQSYVDDNGTTKSYINAINGSGQQLWGRQFTDLMGNISISDVDGVTGEEIVLPVSNWSKRTLNIDGTDKATFGVAAGHSAVLIDVDFDGIKDILSTSHSGSLGGSRIYAYNGANGSLIDGFPITLTNVTLNALYGLNLHKNSPHGNDLIALTSAGVYVINKNSKTVDYVIGSANEYSTMLPGLSASGNLNVMFYANNNADGRFAEVYEFNDGAQKVTLADQNDEAISMSGVNPMRDGSWLDLPLRVGTYTPPASLNYGYHLVASDGGIFPFGDAQGLGSTGNINLWKPIVGMASTPTGNGYWLVASDGGIFPFGDAPGLGSAGGIKLWQPIVGMAATPSGNGYWMVAADGGIFTYGDAQYYGSTGGVRLTKPIVGMASTPTGNGYWLVASDGGIFPFGDAQGLGPTGNINLWKPIVGMASTPTGNGYWLVASDGGIFPFGDAQGLGSTGNINLWKPIVGMASTPTGNGYWLVASDGGIFPFGDAQGLGSTGGVRLAKPIVGMSAVAN